MEEWPDEPKGPPQNVDPLTFCLLLYFSFFSRCDVYNATCTQALWRHFSRHGYIHPFMDCSHTVFIFMTINIKNRIVVCFCLFLSLI